MKTRLHQVKFNAIIRLPNTTIITKECLLDGGGLLVDLPDLVRIALRKQHDIEACSLIRISWEAR